MVLYRFEKIKEVMPDLEKDDSLSGRILSSQWLWPAGILAVFGITVIICLL